MNHAKLCFLIFAFLLLNGCTTYDYWHTDKKMVEPFVTSKHETSCILGAENACKYVMWSRDECESIKVAKCMVKKGFMVLIPDPNAAKYANRYYLFTPPNKCKVTDISRVEIEGERCPISELWDWKFWDRRD